MENPEFKHLMIDIETLGHTSRSVITSIAAVPFNMDGETGEPYYVKVDIDSCLKHGLNVTGETVHWWLTQDPSMVKEMLTGTIPLSPAIHKLWSFVKNLDNTELQIWANGARFDFGILSDAYAAVGCRIPWHFRYERDLRTLVSLLPSNDKLLGLKNDHNALNDCYNQIKRATLVHNLLKKQK